MEHVRVHPVRYRVSRLFDRLTGSGIYGALLWVPASILSIVAVKFAGLAVAQGTWAGVSSTPQYCCVPLRLLFVFAVLVSFIWGATFFKQPVVNLPLAIVALCMLIVAIVGVATSSLNVWRKCSRPPSFSVQENVVPVQVQVECCSAFAKCKTTNSLCVC